MRAARNDWIECRLSARQASGGQRCGACAGAGTVTAALRSIQEEADSKLPVLGYTVPYALGNILLTAWGPVIVALTR